ncbi:uncharacterized protein LOC109546550 [Dendroctonus ponderosae]|uniref:Protein sleepless n=1 Tax=Dendroctonus ponderosae TaxID=77166 RepID=U4URH4_DENPD|nr:uncharacterized protein LOC109546550 [Dendroctonus ponderosae]ERL95707.1 hypothetical protein D910_00141 [Dendroctonus ponderosae]KAH1016065.1 hypothetical protein HUJ04_007345 [Dendroctonus ponderosae]KAH1025516.1 hypothetical protein HUJ05_010228 [Dendroctonus ponderosae]
MNNLGILVFSGCLAVVIAQAANSSILCFTCNPTHSSRCLANTLNQPTNCSAPNNLTAPACFSEYLNYNNVSGNTVWNNFTGIHRGCIGANMTLVNYCSRNLAPNVTRLSCQTCNSSRCNTHTFSNNGGITGPGTGADGTSGGSGASNIIPFVSLIIFSFFVSHIKAGFRGSN